MYVARCTDLGVVVARPWPLEWLRHICATIQHECIEQRPTNMRRTVVLFIQLELFGWLEAFLLFFGPQNVFFTLERFHVVFLFSIGDSLRPALLRALLSVRQTDHAGRCLASGVRLAF